MKEIIIDISKVSGAYGIGAKLLLDDYSEEKAMNVIMEVHDQILCTRSGSLIAFGPELVHKVEEFIKENVK